MVHLSGSRLIIPDEYRVIDINRAVDTLYVCACYWSETDAAYRSELWMFRVDQGAGEIKFESRQVLASYVLQGGEGLNLCRSVVSCRMGAALFVQQWEHGSTRVFRQDGSEIVVDWPRTKTEGGHCCVDFIRPVGWVPGASGSFELACTIYFHGDDDQYLLLYTLESGQFESGPMNEVLGGRGTELFAGFDRFW
jgi:hypothetical protein